MRFSYSYKLLCFCLVLVEERLCKEILEDISRLGFESPRQIYLYGGDRDLRERVAGMLRERSGAMVVLSKGERGSYDVDLDWFRFTYFSDE